MSEKTFHVEIITPRKVVFNDDVLDFIAPGTNGSFEILRDHTAFISSIRVGELRLRQPDGYEDYYATSGGYVEVHDNKVTFLAETCEKASDIDTNRAKQAHERALKRMEDRANYNPEQARLALLRAQNRLAIAEKHLKNHESLK
jgi:F-type H+-transporting ATPase subunit epsilon